MDITRTAFGTWSGGRYMHFGEAVAEDRFIDLVRHAWKQGIRTFMTADVYGAGEADAILGRALKGLPRDSYCLVGAVGHDFYSGKREGAKGFPRFTHPSLRQPKAYGDYLRMAAEKSLDRCQADYFDLLLLHNPDRLGYTHEAVWKSMGALKETHLARRIGIAPGPANGFSLDLILCFERFGSLLDWAMIILNPLEPWPGNLCLPAANKYEVQIITRVVDYGGLFHDDVKPGHPFNPTDHRTFRPAGWVEAGCQKIEKMRPFAQKYRATMLQLACLWNLAHSGVKSVIPTLIQETSPQSKSIESKAQELASLPDITLSDQDRQEIALIGNNKGCMELKGGNPGHTGEALADRWKLDAELESVGKRWNIDPHQDLVCTHRKVA